MVSLEKEKERGNSLPVANQGLSTTNSHHACLQHPVSIISECIVPSDIMQPSQIENKELNYHLVGATLLLSFCCLQCSSNDCIWWTRPISPRHDEPHLLRLWNKCMYVCVASLPSLLSFIYDYCKLSSVENTYSWECAYMSIHVHT